MEWKGEGHNPLGALSVFALLGLLTVQVVTGLFANDDITFVGPLFELVSKALSNRLTSLHQLTFIVLIGLVVLHIAAIGFYGHFKKQRLLKPMITGWKEGDAVSASGALCCAHRRLPLRCCNLRCQRGAWLPEPPPPPPAAETPSW